MTLTATAPALEARDLEKMYPGDVHAVQGHQLRGGTG